MFAKLAGIGWFKSVWFGSTWIESESLWFQVIELLRPTFSTSTFFCAQHFRKLCCLHGFHFQLFLRHAPEIPCRRYTLPSDWVKDVVFSITVRLWVVVMMGPCGFIPVRFSILWPDLVTSVLLSKIPRGGSNNHCVPVRSLGWSVIQLVE